MGMRTPWRVVQPMIGFMLLTSVTTAGSAEFVRVKVDTATVRRGPGTTAERVRRAFENEPLKVIGRKGRWLLVADFDGGRGWIYAPLTDARAAAVVTEKVVNVRSGPGRGHQIVFTAERGVNFLVLDEERNWLAIEHEGGERGWIHESLVWGHW